MNNGDILKPLIRLGATADDCWLWLGQINKRTGYGKKQFLGKSVLAHRWVFQMFNGWLPQEGVLDHKCRNRACVNPRHLEPVTQTENCRRGRTTKLTLEQAREIKSRLPALRWGERKKLAEEFGVSQALISDIKYGRAWADVE